MLSEKLAALIVREDELAAAKGDIDWEFVRFTRNLARKLPLVAQAAKLEVLVVLYEPSTGNITVDSQIRSDKLKFLLNVATAIIPPLPKE